MGAQQEGNIKTVTSPNKAQMTLTLDLRWREENKKKLALDKRL